MKEDALRIAEEVSSPADRLNLLREYMQALALRSLHESEAFTHLSFVGGTALRFLYSLPRFSEDLDFSLEFPTGYTPMPWIKKLNNDLRLAGFNAAVTWSDKSTVHKAWIRVADLLKEAGLAAIPQQNLSIKIEIDTRPPKGAVTKTGIVNRHTIFSIRYHDSPSLMAGKLHALITRKYTKGRDWYDLMWYRSQRPPIDPNLVLLQNALDQTERKGTFSAEDWRTQVKERIGAAKPAALVNDIRPFLEHPEEASLLTRDNLYSLMRDK